MNTAPPATRSRGGLLRWIVPLSLIGFLVSRLNWGEILPLLMQIPPLSLGLSALAFLLSQGVIAVRWHYLLRVQGIRPRLGRLIWLVLIGAFASNFLPTTIGGDVLKMAAIARGQTQRAVAVASVIADRLFNLIAMMFWLPCASTLSGLSTLLFGTGPFAVSLASPGHSLWQRLRIAAGRVMQAGRAWFTSPSTVLVALSLSWLSIGLSFLSFWLLTEAVAVPLSFWQASGIAVLAYFAALIPISINGLGLLEGSVTALLISQGASLEQSATAALLMRLVILAVSLLGGIRLLGWRDLLGEARRFQETQQGVAIPFPPDDSR